MNLLNRISTAVAARAAWPRALALFTITYLIYFLMVGVTIPFVQTYANGMPIFDMMPFGYTYEDAETLLRQLGDEGISAYLTRQIPLDFLYPGLMGLTGAMFLALLAGHRKKSAPWLILLPLAAGLMDYMENAAIIAMLSLAPAPPSGVVTAASAFSMLKSMLSTVYYVALLILLAARSLAFIKQRIGGTAGH